MFKVWACALVLVTGVLLCAAPPAYAGPAGAIFTTLSDGSAVNANQYDSKCSVYLDGGPGPHAPARAAGLADGDYLFQVTDPSGSKLLSTDPVSNRRFRVANGVITAYTGMGGPVHPTGLDRDHPELGAISIQVSNTTCPADVLNTPNNGGAYKVWVTPVASYLGDPANVDNPCGAGCFHGFLPSQSKTDNFKAASGPTFCSTLQKELIQPDGSAVRTPGWAMTVTDSLGVSNTYFTNDTGQVQVCGLTPGTYTVSESLNGAEVVGLIVNGTSLDAVDSVYSFTWDITKPQPVILFQNLFPLPD